MDSKDSKTIEQTGVSVDSSILLIQPVCTDSKRTERLNELLEQALSGCSVTKISRPEDMTKETAAGKKILFAISLGVSGVNLEYYAFLKAMRLSKDLFEGSVAALIVDGSGQFYTKSVARELVLAANMAGCAFVGRPLVEGTGDLYNYTIQARRRDTDQKTAYLESARELVERLLETTPVSVKNPHLLVLYGGNSDTSNSYGLWRMVAEHLEGFTLTEISLRNGRVRDCRGCSYETCLHFGENGKCFYGGVITEEVYPEISNCDGLVMVCPNYNDALGGNLTAFINRMTAIFQVRKFFDTRLFGIIVSGYSGSDIVAQQLISGLCMNKSFYLPPRFAMMETANDPGAIQRMEGIRERARAFGEHMKSCYK